MNNYILRTALISSLILFIIFPIFAQNLLEPGNNFGDNIHSGFVFWNGTYIDPPYTIARKGLALFINEIMIERPIEWPPYDYRVFDDPGIPKVTKNSNWDDIEDPIDFRNAHWRKKLRYLEQHYKAEEARQLIIKYFSELPFLKSVDLHPELKDILVINEISGAKHLVNIEMGEDNYIAPPSLYEVENLIDIKKNHLEERLTKGDYYFFFDSGNYISFSQNRAIDIIPKALEVLLSNQTYEEKRSQLVEIELLPPETKTFDKLITNFSISQSFYNRMEITSLKK